LLFEIIKFVGQIDDPRTNEDLYILSLSDGAADVNWNFFKRPVVVFTFWDINRVITVKGEVIEDGALWASTDGGVFAFLADVEEAAVIGFHVSGVIKGLAIGVDLSGVGATEAISEDLNTGAASLSVSLMFPLAGTSELIEDQASGAAPLDGNTASALIVLVAD